jgi:choline monooxygenase
VVTTRGNRKSLQCGYHGWVYGLDGRLQTAREMEGTKDFDKADFGLVPIRVDTLGPFVFANLDPNAAPLEDWIGAIPSEIAAAGYEMSSMRRIERREYEIACNWKVYVDNYLEGYHLPIAHPGLFRDRVRPVPRRDLSLLLEAARAHPRAEAGRGAGSRSPLHPHAGRRG